MVIVKFKITEGILILDFEGELDSINTIENFRKINAIIAEHQEKEVIFNFHWVTYINSTGIWQLMDVHASLLESGRGLHVSNLYYTVENTLTFVWSFRFLKKYGTEEQAINSILYPELAMEENDNILQDPLLKDL